MFDFRPSNAAGVPRFGLRVENRQLKLVVAEPVSGGRYRVRTDTIESDSHDFLTGDPSRLFDALQTLGERNHVRRHPIAVSLDGDHCVTRIETGNTTEVARQARSLQGRVQRYLSLGTGPKVTGRHEENIDLQTCYAATSVANRNVIRRLHDTFTLLDWVVSFVEPSLISLARLIGRDADQGQRPLLIADGTGSRWDVGIVAGGRLLLDYRPAEADSVEGLHSALRAHHIRLQRFCRRRKGLAEGSLTDIRVCGNRETMNEAISALQPLDRFRTEALTIGRDDPLWDDRTVADNDTVAAATVLPAILERSSEAVPDLLSEVRGRPRRRKLRRAIALWTPPAVSAATMGAAFLGAHYESGRLAETGRWSESLETRVEAAEIAYRRRTYLDDRQAVRDGLMNRVSHRPWQEALDGWASRLPPPAYIAEFTAAEPDRAEIKLSAPDESTALRAIDRLNQAPGWRASLRSRADGGGGETVMVVQVTAHSNTDAAANPRPGGGFQ